MFDKEIIIYFTSLIPLMTEFLFAAIIFSGMCLKFLLKIQRLPDEIDLIGTVHRF